MEDRQHGQPPAAPQEGKTEVEVQVEENGGDHPGLQKHGPGPKQPQQPELGPNDLLVGAAINNLNDVPQAMAQAAEREQAREEERLYTDQVGLCSGDGVEAIYLWLCELEIVPPLLRRRVLDRTARGVLKEALWKHFRHNPRAPWNATTDAVSRAFIAKDHLVSLREELT